MSVSGKEHHVTDAKTFLFKANASPKLRANTRQSISKADCKEAYGFVKDDRYPYALRIKKIGTDQEPDLSLTR